MRAIRQIIACGLTLTALLTPRPAQANCEKLIGLAGLFIPEPCPVFDTVLAKQFGKQNVEAAMSIQNSLQQLMDMARQLQNDITFLKSMFSSYDTLQVSFTPFTDWSQIDSVRGLNPQAMIQNYTQAFFSTVQNIGYTQELRNISQAQVYAGRMAAAAQAYAIRQQTYSTGTQNNDIAALANAVTTSTSLNQDWDANTAIRIKIIQQQQIRNTLIARLAATQASNYALPMMPRLSETTSAPYATQSTTFSLPMPTDDSTPNP